MSTEMKLMRSMAKYIWQNYKTNEDILSELKIKPAVKKLQITEINGLQHVQRLDRERLPQT